VAKKIPTALISRIRIAAFVFASPLDGGPERMRGRTSASVLRIGHHVAPPGAQGRSDSATVLAMAEVSRDGPVEPLVGDRCVPGDVEEEERFTAG
jgi:hypothetical protein